MASYQLLLPMRVTSAKHTIPALQLALWMILPCNITRSLQPRFAFHFKEFNGSSRILDLARRLQVVALSMAAIRQSCPKSLKVCAAYFP
jgi:hypothetical protein